LFVGLLVVHLLHELPAEEGTPVALQLSFDCMMSNRFRSLTHIPVDVEYLPPDHLISLLRTIAAERDDLFLALQNEQAKAAVAAASTFQHQHHAHHTHNSNHLGAHNHNVTTHDPFGFPYPNQHHLNHNLHHHPPPAVNATNDTQPTATAFPQLNLNPPNNNSHEHINHFSNTVPSTFKVDAVKKRIAKKSFLLVKKTAHNKAKKPYTELNESVPNAAAAMALFEGFEPKSDTHRLAKWELTGDEIVEWLNLTSNWVHPVKFDGKVIAFGGAKPFVYAWASYDTLQARFDKKGASLSLKFRTKMVGSGRPKEGQDGPPSLT
jgi:hypothetical protein